MDGAGDRELPIDPTPRPPTAEEEQSAFDELQERLHNDNLALSERLHNESIAAQFEIFELQQLAEQEKRDRANALISQINQQFAGRDSIYDNFRNLTYEANIDNLNEQQEDSQRSTRFGLARSGLAGGSVDTDLFSEIARRYDTGLIQANNFADSAASDLRAQDQSTKNNLIGLASSGNVDSSILGGLNSSLAATSNIAKTPVINPASDGQFSGIGDALGAGLFQVGQQQSINSNSPRVSSPKSNYSGRIS